MVLRFTSDLVIDTLYAVETSRARVPLFRAGAPLFVGPAGIKSRMCDVGGNSPSKLWNSSLQRLSSFPGPSSHRPASVEKDEEGAQAEYKEEGQGPEEDQSTKEKYSGSTGEGPS